MWLPLLSVALATAAEQCAEASCAATEDAGSVLLQLRVEPSAVGEVESELREQHFTRHELRLLHRAAAALERRGLLAQHLDWTFWRKSKGAPTPAPTPPEGPSETEEYPEGFCDRLCFLVWSEKCMMAEHGELNLKEAKKTEICEDKFVPRNGGYKRCAVNRKGACHVQSLSGEKAMAAGTAGWCPDELFAKKCPHHSNSTVQQPLPSDDLAKATARYFRARCLQYPDEEECTRVTCSTEDPTDCAMAEYKEPTANTTAEKEEPTANTTAEKA